MNVSFTIFDFWLMLDIIVSTALFSGVHLLYWQYIEKITTTMTIIIINSSLIIYFWRNFCKVSLSYKDLIVSSFNETHTHDKNFNFSILNYRGKFLLQEWTPKIIKFEARKCLEYCDHQFPIFFIIGILSKFSWHFIKALELQRLTQFEKNKLGIT